MEKRLPFIVVLLLAVVLAVVGVRWLVQILGHQQHDAHMLAKARQLSRVISLYPQLPPGPVWEALTNDSDIHIAVLYVDGKPVMETRADSPGSGQYQRLQLRLSNERLLSFSFNHHPLPWQLVLTAMTPMLLAFVLLLWLLLRLVRHCLGQRQEIYAFEKEVKQNQIASSGTFPEVRQALLTLQRRVHTLESQQQQIDSLLHSAAWLDEESGLGNRLFFEQRLASWLQELEGNRIGCVMLLELSNLDKVKADALSQWRQGLVSLLHDKAALWPDAVLARVDEDEYALLLPQMPSKEGQAFALGLLSDVQRLQTPSPFPAEDWVHLGWTLYQAGDEASSLLDKTEMALRAAQLQGENAIMTADVESMPQLETGSVRWRTLLEQVLARKAIMLASEPVHSLDGNINHLRVRALINDPKGKQIDDSVFMPMACRVGQEEPLMRLCLQQLLGRLGHARNRGHRLAFRLCVDALLKNGFNRWLQLALMEVRDLLPQLTLIVTEHELQQHGNKLIEPLQQLSAIGVGIMVDRIASHSQQAQWQQIKPRMLKLHGAMVRHIHRNSDQQLWVQRLVQKAVDTNTEVLASGIVDNQERLCLHRLGVSGGDGPLFGHGAWDLL
ncbi:EAL domain-containing protein [Gallaecimonas mangrovi]|uniref:EAL domain-containing protein n=1 Tax=Gallaecimonas mangrovi TaxID=2291597 RepID=UPI000E2073A4|nr:EAL domain-containing protein [Gallaecimonas mangrovi]